MTKVRKPCSEKIYIEWGLNEGLEVLHQLASHPSTARFICKKIATRFVSDTPSVALVTAMAAVFTQSGGDIKQTMIAMLNSREFWKRKSCAVK